MQKSKVEALPIKRNPENGTVYDPKKRNFDLRDRIDMHLTISTINNMPCPVEKWNDLCRR